MKIRAFTEYSIEGSGIIELSPEESRYLKILRLFTGDEVEIISLPHLLYAHAEISEIKNKIFTIKCGSPAKMFYNKKYIRIIHGITEYEKPELVIQKCTELGIDEIILISSERSKNIMESKIPKYKKVIQEALRQSKSYTPTKISTAELNEDFLNSLVNEYNFSVDTNSPSFENNNIKPAFIVFYQHGEIAGYDFFQKLNGCSLINAFIGPESGFSNDEIIMFEKVGAEFVSISGNVLRSETAAVSAAAVLKIGTA